MSTMPFRWKKWLTIAVVLGMLAVGPGRYFHNKYENEIRKWLQTQARWTSYRLTSGLKHDLAVGNIKAGDDIEAVLSKYPLPTHEKIIGNRREDYGRWTLVTYGGGFEGTGILARDGKLVEASHWSCTFSDEFIVGQLTPAEQADFNETREAWYENRRRTRSTLYSFLTGNAARFYFEEGSGESIAPLLQE